MPMVAPPREKRTTSTAMTTSPLPRQARTIAVDQSLDGPGGVDDAEGAADQEDVEDDVGGFHEALREGQKDLCEAGRIGLHGVVGLRDDQLTTLVLHAIERAGGNEVGGDRGEHDQPEQQRVGVGHPQLHEVRPQNSAAAIA